MFSPSFLSFQHVQTLSECALVMKDITHGFSAICKNQVRSTSAASSVLRLSGFKATRRHLCHVSLGGASPQTSAV